MSTFVGVRIPNELIAKVDARGKRTRVIIDAIKLYLEFQEPPEVPAEVGRTVKAIQEEVEAATGAYEMRVERAGVRCPDPKHQGFRRSDGWWCMTCRKMY